MKHINPLEHLDRHPVIIYIGLPNIFYSHYRTYLGLPIITVIKLIGFESKFLKRRFVRKLS